MSELNLTNDMDSDVVRMAEKNNDSLTQNNVKESTGGQIESSRARNTVADAIKRIQSEKQVFPDKEDVAETTTVNEASDNKTSTRLKNVDNKIFGMKPLNLGLVLLGVGVIGYIAYKKLKK